jgi:hypothetical protein
MTDAGQAKRYVIVGVTGAGALAAVDQLARGDVPSARIGVGVIFTGAMLLVLAEFAPGLAAGFGALILTTAALVTGADAWKAITRITK